MASGATIGNSSFAVAGGAMTTSMTIPPVNTLNEPIKETIKRDLKSIAEKFAYVFKISSFSEGGGILKNWDLWGPLFVCLVLGTVLWAQAADSQKKMVFGIVFVVYWAGAGILTLNSILLGGRPSFFQAASVLGYAMCPITLAAMICLVIPPAVAFLKLFVLGAALYWSGCVSVSYFSGLIDIEDKKGLTAFPVWLFYANFSWMVMLM